MEIKKKIGERILFSRKQNNMTGVELAKQLNTSKQRISGWENGRRTPSLDDALKLEEILGVSALYLLCVNDDDSHTKTSTGLNKKNFGSLPLYNCSDIKKNMDTHSGWLPIPPTIESKLSNDDFGFIVNDKSMESKFNVNDIVVFSKSSMANHNDVILVKLVSNQQILIRKLYIDNSNTKNQKIILLASNSEWPDININSESEFTIIGHHQSNLSLYF